MKLARLALLITLVTCASPLHARSPLAKVDRWFMLLDYEPQTHPITAEEFLKYEMGIFDPDHHPSFSKLDGQMVLIGTLSLTEADTRRFYWPANQTPPWAHPLTKPSTSRRSVDVTDERWQALVLDQILPHLIVQGFNGALLTDLHKVSQAEENESDSQTALLELIGKIHEKYPSFLLISNNGLDLLDKLAPMLDGMMVEDVCMRFDPQSEAYVAVPKEERAYKVKRLQALMKQFKLPVYSLDYVPESDTNAARKCWVFAKRVGFRPYLAEGSLDQIYTYPMTKPRQSWRQRQRTSYSDGFVEEHAANSST